MENDLLQCRTADVMTAAPKTMSADSLAATALRLMNEEKITSLFIVEDGRPTGILHIHDLLRAGIV